jgi:hypothetical protein
VEDSEAYGIGKTDIGTLVPRGRFSYWCFDLLFLICSDATTGTFALFQQLYPCSDIR